MEPSQVSRRDFSRWTALAFGGVVAGSLAGCGSKKEEKKAAGEQASAGDLHVCRGLNACKGKGKGGDNACAGQGKCASAADHSCSTHNECKGQGGCGEKPGENACKGQGQCAVPLMDSAWEKARKSFEDKMKAAGKEVGAAPAKT